MKTGTKLANNPKYGLPRNRKIMARLNGWRVWAQGMALLRQIHVEIAEKLNAKTEADSMLQNSTIIQKTNTL
jgi:hypothetical protein